MMNKYELSQTLQNGVATVVFTKADGSLRSMRCTLLAEYLPAQVGAQLLTEDAPVRKENPDALAVWDIENGGWRSFRLDSIQSISVG